MRLPLINMIMAGWRLTLSDLHVMFPVSSIVVILSKTERDMHTRQGKPKTRHGTMAIFPQTKKKPKKLASGSGKGPQRSFPSEGQQPKPRRKSGWQKRIDIGNVDVDPNMRTFPTLPPTNDDIDIHPNPKSDEEIEKEARRRVRRRWQWPRKGQI